jgi:two-component system sensor histidine kinase TctE
LLKEALSNLLHNAIRYTPRGGQVTVSVARGGDTAALTVLDDGPGIPPAERARAGERFFRGSKVALPGSGLGLAIVRSIAQRYGGELRLESGPDERGLRVSIVLPLAPLAQG